jgi:hypothetical protein
MRRRAAVTVGAIVGLAVWAFILGVAMAPGFALAQDAGAQLLGSSSAAPGDNLTGTPPEGAVEMCVRFAWDAASVEAGIPATTGSCWAASPYSALCSWGAFHGELWGYRTSCTVEYYGASEQPEDIGPINWVDTVELSWLVILVWVGAYSMRALAHAVGL